MEISQKEVLEKEFKELKEKILHLEDCF